MKFYIKKLIKFNLKYISKIFTFKKSGNGSKSFLLACMQKSGSSWISTTFDKMPRCIKVHFVPTYGGREQEIDAWTINFNLFRFRRFNTIAQHHVKYNRNTRNCLIRHGIRPIVLTRNIKDNLVSVVDHWRKEDSNPSPFLYIERNYFNDEFTLSSSSSCTPLEYATILHAPWILNFYMSWKKNNSNPYGKLPNHLSPIFITYEDFIDNPYESFSSLFRKMNLDFTDQELLNAINDKSRKERKNVGIKGRGEEAFSKDKKANDALNRILDLYRHEDLSGLGIF